MAITAAQVKELRERTGAGMMECKKYLTEANGDMDAAIAAMRKAGQAKAAKKSGRIAAEGLITALVSDDGKTGILLEVNSETDFVARDENFSRFVDDVTAIALQEKTDSVEALNAITLPSAGTTIEEARQNLIAKLGENIHVRRVHCIQAESPLGCYTHSGRIGVLVEISGGDDELRKNIAMHIAASQPRFINPEDVPQAVVAEEKEIFTAQAVESGKPADIIEKMIGGRVKKFLAEISLIGQPFVRDADTTVGAELNRKNAKVLRFERFELGEGIERKDEDFREAVMAQVRGE